MSSLRSRLAPSLVVLSLPLAACGGADSSAASSDGQGVGGALGTGGAAGKGTGAAGAAGAKAGAGGGAAAGGGTGGSAGQGGSGVSGGAGQGGGAAGVGGSAGQAGGAGGSGQGGGAAGVGGSAGQSGGGAGGGGATTTVRVHYPAGTHKLTLRGAAGGLSWTQGLALSPSGDVWSVTLSGLAAPTELKPLLDDTTWARGPNYRVVPGQTLDLYPHFTTQTGKVVTLINGFHSAALNNDRDIWAYLPPSYDENTDATYPVVYMHDGQNLWAALPQMAFGATWNVDTTFDSAAELGACSKGGVVGWGAQPLGQAATTCTGDGDCPSSECRTFPEAIVIGIANNANRIYELTPTTDPSTPGGGGADLYLKMVATELKPKIDSMLRTRPDVDATVLSGSSLGGLVTAYGALKYPAVFGRVAELSPSSWWNNDVIVDDVKTTLPAPMRPTFVYVDSGAGTADDQVDTDMLAAEYLKLGYVDGVNFRHVVQPGAAHSEVYWAQRFPGAMQQVLGAR